MKEDLANWRVGQSAGYGTVLAQVEVMAVLDNDGLAIGTMLSIRANNSTKSRRASSSLN
jgi:hypothetical protein